jgi:hypothetical protein
MYSLELKQGGLGAITKEQAIVPVAIAPNILEAKWRKLHAALYDSSCCRMNVSIPSMS